MNAYARTLEATASLAERLSEAAARVVALEAENASLRASVAQYEAMLAESTPVRNIITAVSEYYSVSHAALLSKRRNQSLARARQVVMYLAREMTQFSYARIGGFLGDRDHTTIMYGADLIAKLVESGDISDDVVAIKARIRAMKLPSFTKA